MRFVEKEKGDNLGETQTKRLISRSEINSRKLHERHILCKNNDHDQNQLNYQIQSPHREARARWIK